LPVAKPGLLILAAKRPSGLGRAFRAASSRWYSKTRTHPRSRRRRLRDPHSGGTPQSRRESVPTPPCSPWVWRSASHWLFPRAVRLFSLASSRSNKRTSWEASEASQRASVYFFFLVAFLAGFFFVAMSHLLVGLRPLMWPQRNVCVRRRLD